MSSTLSKEEILENWVGAAVVNEDMDLNGFKKAAVLFAMDEYAKQECLLFAEYHMRRVKLLNPRIMNDFPDALGESLNLSINLYLQSKQKQK